VTIKLRLNTDDDVLHITHHYDQSDELQVFLSLLREGMVVVDVGANIGLYTLLSARRVGATGKVFAFEPVPHVYERLKENIAVNAITNVYALQLALSDAPGTARLFTGRNSMQGSLYRQQTLQTIDVTTTSLDQFLGENGVEKVDAVKIDAEGAEMHILRGMHQLLSSENKPILLVEHNDTALAAAGTSPAELFHSIVRYGYSAFLVERGVMKPVADVQKAPDYYAEAHLDYVFIPTGSPMYDTNYGLDKGSHDV